KPSRPTLSSLVPSPNSTAAVISIASTPGRIPRLDNHPLVRSPVDWYFFSDDPQYRKTSVPVTLRVQTPGRPATGHRETCPGHREKQKRSGLAGGDWFGQNVHDGQCDRPHQQTNSSYRAQ